MVMQSKVLEALLNLISKVAGFVAGFFVGRQSKENEKLKYENKVLKKQRDVKPSGNPLKRMRDKDL